MTQHRTNTQQANSKDTAEENKYCTVLHDTGRLFCLCTLLIHMQSRSALSEHQSAIATCDLATQPPTKHQACHPCHLGSKPTQRRQSSAACCAPHSAPHGSARCGSLGAIDQILRSASGAHPHSPDTSKIMHCNDQFRNRDVTPPRYVGTCIPKHFT